MLAAVLGVSALLLTACGGGGSPEATPTREGPTAAAPSTGPTEPSTATPSDGTGPSTPEAGGPAESWPTGEVSAPFTGEVPPVPLLIDIRAGSHPSEGFDRIAFEFEGLPGYTVGYVSEVVRDGSGESVDLSGEAFLQMVFNPAQAHDDEGESTLGDPPVEPVNVGFAALDAYVLTGDFEGYVSIAVGLTGTLGFHVAQFRQSDGDYVVYVDVRRP